MLRPGLHPCAREELEAFAALVRPFVPAVELRDGSNLETYTGRYGLSGKHVLCSSDSHNLWTVGDCGASIELDDEPYSSARVRGALIEMLRGDAP